MIVRELLKPWSHHFSIFALFIQSNQTWGEQWASVSLQYQALRYGGFVFEDREWWEWGNCSCGQTQETSKQSASKSVSHCRRLFWLGFFFVTYIGTCPVLKQTVLLCEAIWRYTASLEIALIWCWNCSQYTNMQTTLAFLLYRRK